MNFNELFKQLQSEEAVNSVGKSSKGAVGNFGINQNASLKLFYGKSKERDGESQDQITMFVTTKEGGTFMGWIQEPLSLTRKGMKNDALKHFTKTSFTNLFNKAKSGKATVDELLYLQDYVEKFNQQKAYLKNIFESYFTESEIEKRIALWKNIVKMTDFDKMLLAFIKLFPQDKNNYENDDPNHYMKSHKMTKEAKVDVFLQYQWSLKKGNKKTYLELPKNIKQGLTFSKVTTGDFKVIEGSTYLAVDEEGNEHPLTRNEWFMGSKFANQQNVGEELEDLTTDAEESGWGDFNSTSTSDNDDDDLPDGW